MVFFRNLYNWICSDLGVSLTAAFFARLLAAMGSFLLLVIIGKNYGVAGVGLHAMIQSFAVGLAVFARLGMDNALLRFVATGKNSSVSKTYLKVSCSITFGLSVFFAVVLVCFRSKIAVIFGMAELAYLLLWVGLGLPAFSLSLLLSGYFKGIRKVVAAALADNGMLSLWCCLIIIVFTSLGWEGLNVIGVAFFISAWLVLVQNALSVYSSRGCLLTDNPQLLDMSGFFKSSKSFFVHSISGLIQTVVFIFVLGLFLGEEEVGVFRAAQQIGILISFVLIVINVVYPARFSAAYAENNRHLLEKLAVQSATLGFVICMPAVVACLLFPKYILGLLGSDFESAAVYLQVISFAQLFNVATGSVGFLLAMAGRESIVKNISLCCGLLGVLAAAWLSSSFGVVGSVASYAGMIVMQNLLLVIFAKKEMGILVFPRYRI